MTLNIQVLAFVKAIQGFVINQCINVSHLVFFNYFKPQNVFFSANVCFCLFVGGFAIPHFCHLKNKLQVVLFD
jgi:hypothetical protein